MESNLKTYIPGLDTVKMIGLWLMILGHANLVDETLCEAIYSFHMPLFFSISGFLFKYRSFQEQIYKSWKCILVPYLMVNGVCLLMSAVAGLFHDILSFSYLLDRVVPICIGLGYNFESYVPVCTPMWFFYVIFFLQLFFNIVGDKGINRFLFCLSSMIGCILLKINNINTLIPIDSLLMAVPFFYLGIIMKQLLNIFQKNQGRGKYDNVLITIIIGFLLFVGIFIGLFNGRVDMNSFMFGNRISLFYISAIMTSSGLIIASLHMGGGRFSRLISNGAPVIVGFNLMITGFIKKIIFIALPTLEWNNLIGLAVSIFTLLILLVLIQCASIICPSILGYRNIEKI